MFVTTYPGGIKYYSAPGDLSVRIPYGAFKGLCINIFLSHKIAKKVNGSLQYVELRVANVYI